MSRKSGDNAPKRRATGRPFQKGHPGGPGRPRLSDLEREVRETERRELAEALQSVQGQERLKRIVKAAYDRAEKHGDFSLLDKIHQRVMGPIPQRHEITGEEGGPVEFDAANLSDDALRKILGIIRTDSPKRD